MNKKLTFILVWVMALSLAACSGKKDSDSTTDSSISNEETEDTSNEVKESTEDPKTEVKEDPLETLEILVNKDVEDTIAVLTKNYENLTAEIDTYEKYKENAEKVESFYTDTCTIHQELTLRLKEYALTYAETILSSNSSTDDMYEELEKLYDVVYDGSGDDVYDDIHDGILDDMYGFYYEGLLDDAYDTVPYDEWSELSSNEYDWWSDACSTVYDDWSDFRSDVYDFWDDLRSEVWDDDIEKATEMGRFPNRHFQLIIDL